jgi:hypothetical protein
MPDGNAYQIPFIVENSERWAPDEMEVLECLATMKAKGFRTDWRYCLALQTHALMFADHSDSEQVDSCLIAYKGQFLTEEEYYDAE